MRLHPFGTFETRNDLPLVANLDGLETAPLPQSLSCKLQRPRFVTHSYPFYRGHDVEVALKWKVNVRIRTGLGGPETAQVSIAKIPES
jgi:hypothetical protein